MPDYTALQAVQIGATVAYRLSSGDVASDARGKVIGLFKTLNGQTLADVQWDKLGPPMRVNVHKLITV